EGKFIDSFTELIARITLGIEQFKYNGLNIGTDIFVINYLYANKDCTMKDLIKYLRTIPSTATRRVDKLVKNGFVVREAAEKDRRSVKLILTPKGEDLYASFIDNRMKGLKIMLDKFDSPDLEAFFRVISGLSQKNE
ncbi:MAG: MarR family winged helix-turn-helix transcriptional regulator, partial [Candidatus Hodarchaeales archaeon]